MYVCGDDGRLMVNLLTIFINVIHDFLSLKQTKERARYKIDILKLTQ